ncbi:MAG: helix-turn-helix domain-containing protein [Prevotella sp.]
MLYDYLSGTVGFVLCLEGEQDAISNGHRIHIVPGMVCVFSPIVSLQIQEDNCRLLKMELSLSNIYRQLSKVMNVLSRMRLDQAPYTILTEEQQDFFVKRFTDIEERRKRLDGTADKVLRMLAQQNIVLLEQQTLVEMLAMFYSNHHEDFALETSRQQDVVFRFAFSLSLNFKQHRTVDYYASEANMTPSYFTRVVKQQTGRTPMYFIHTITCTAARNILSQTERSIKEIACELGFPEQFTFRKYFKTHVGLSPTDYRNRSRNSKTGKDNERD